MKKYFFFLFIAVLFVNYNRAQVISSNFVFQGNTRNYIVYVPASYATIGSFPLLVVFHGNGGNQNGIMGMTGFNPVADTANFIVAYPTALPYNSVNTWNIGGINPGVDDVGFTSALIDTLKVHYPKINLCNVYATGFSMGSGMTQQLGCDLSNRIAAIACVAGGMPISISGTCTPTRAISVLNMKGTTDSYNGNTIELGAQQTIDYWNQLNNCNLTAAQTTLPDLVNDGYTVDRFDYNPCLAGTENVLYRVNNGPHAWIGAGANNGLNDINTSIEVWNFLKKYSNPAVGGCLTPVIEARPSYFSFSLYPNPAAGVTTIEIKNMPPANSRAKIYDLTGNEIMNIEIKSKKTQLETEKLAPGIYFIKLFSDTELLSAKKIICL